MAGLSRHVPRDGEGPNVGRVEKIVLFAPLPPKENGIADYVLEQLPYHHGFADTMVVIDNGDPEPTGVPPGVTVLRLAEYLRQRQALTCFPHLYHVGNNLDHGYMLPVLYSTPGAVVVHDLGLHHLIDTQTLEQGNLEGYAWALWQQYGRFGKLLGQQFLDYRVKGQAMPHELTLNGAIIGAAQQVIVHSNYSANKIRSEWPGKYVTVIPHHLSPTIQAYNRARRPDYRKALGLPEKGALITSLGFINRHKQIETVLQALARLKSEGLAFTYVLAGKCRREEYDVFADIERLNLSDRVIVTGYLDEDAFFKHVAAADLVLNLRYPSWGETSGTMTRALGMGRCCVVVDIGPFAEIPSSCAVKVAWDKLFADNLCNSIRSLVASPELRAGYEVAARDWISTTHSIRSTTDAYHCVLEKVRPGQGVLGWRFGQLGTGVSVFHDKRNVENWLQQDTVKLRSIVEQSGGHLWWRESLLPLAAGDEPIGVFAPPASPALAVLSERFGYAPDHILRLDLEPLTNDALDPMAHGTYPRLLALLSMQRVADDPVAWLAALNWRLRVNGELVLSLRMDLPPEKGSRELPMTLSAWRIYLEAAGFEVLAACEAPADITYSGLEPDSVEPTFRVRKLTERIDRFPKPHYPAAPARHLILARLKDGLPKRTADTAEAQP